MLSRDYLDIVGGAILVVVGLAFAAHAATHYALGTLRHMGPGMFPAILGVLLAVFGMVQAVPALFRQGAMPKIRILTPLLVLTGVSAFALLIRPFGLVPAILAVTTLSSLAGSRVRPLGLAVLSGVLCLLAWLTFRVGLGLPLSMVRWPF